MLGFIGCGTMGTALLEGIMQKGLRKPAEVVVFDQDRSKTTILEEKYGVRVESGAEELCSQAQMIFLAVKPQDMPTLLEKIKDKIRDNHLVISVAAGLRLNFFQNILGSDKKLVRVMPNTPSLIGKGMSVVSSGETVSAAQEQEIVTLLEALGKVMVLDEKHMDVVTALSGSGPAYVLLFIESLADGGVEMGLSRDDAQQLAAQTVYGAASMLLESQENPAVLKNKITSPGGTTSAGLLAMEQGTVRASIIRAVQEATRRSRELGG